MITRTIRSFGVGAVQLTAFIACALLLSGNQARAALLAYEDFDYAVGSSFGGQSGGAGFNGSWQLGGAANNSIVVSGSFGYTDSFGNSLLGSGNRALFTGNGSATGDNTGGDTANSQTRRTLAFTRGTTTETTWISFLAQRTGLPNTPFTNSLGHVIRYGRAAGLQLFYRADGTTAAGTEITSIGRASENTTGINENATHDSWAIYNRGTAVQQAASDVGFASAPADLILMRIDHVAGLGPQTNASIADTAYIWINPPNLTKEPTLAQADMTIKPNTFDATNDRDYIFNQLRLFGGSLNTTVGYGSMEVDRIRLGETMFDVTLGPAVVVPEPTTIAFFVLGSVALLAFRRKR